MRTHLQIITEAGGYKSLAERLRVPAERVRFWERRQSIPLEAWRLVEEAGIASRSELLDAAEAVAIAQREKTEDGAQDHAA